MNGRHEREVAIVGVGMTRLGNRERMGMKELFAEALTEAFADVEKGIDPAAINEVWVGSLKTGGSQLGNTAPLLCDMVHLPDVPAQSVENACAGGAFAFRDGVMSIRSGMNDVVVVAGCEKMNDLTRERNRYWLGNSGDVEWERLAGVSFPGLYAMVALRHFHKYGTSREQLCKIAVKNHKHGLRNPKAQLRFPIDYEKALQAPYIAYPFTLFDVCPITDGAAVAILCRADLAKEFTDTPIYVVGLGAASDAMALHDRADITRFRAAELAAAQAYKEAGVTPANIDVAEVHDCFTIAELITYEALGFCGFGEGGRLVDEKHTELGGRIPVNVSGGLKSKGHPIGATGLCQIYEIVHQLRGDVQEPERQVQGAEIGLAENAGGSVGSCAVTILRR